ncbi:hypothetical protein [Methanosarcina sp.]|uniref:hypothetical protein n=1 Tax=Methanosarcina sp. TaxID=2213 RepID=UPI002ABCAD00|nr:hypothetical protein [Methanosarcina sp.]MDY9925089.1 hypothetical protein [Methanosarcina sp.]
MGKTDLAREFIKGKKNVYLLVGAKTEKLLLRDLGDSMERVLESRPRWIPGMIFFVGLQTSGKADVCFL